MNSKFVVHWFRRDLRLHDNAGLAAAIRSGLPVQPVFIFDTSILDELTDRADARVTFIHNQISAIDRELRRAGGCLQVFHGRPVEVFERLSREWPLKAVFANEDYEPYARARDQEIDGLMAAREISFHLEKDDVIFEKSEILTLGRKPYTVYTPYKNSWRKELSAAQLVVHDTSGIGASLRNSAPVSTVPALDELGFQESSLQFPANSINEQIINLYDERRDIPGIDGTSKLSLHLRFGTVSIRRLVREALRLNEIWLQELIWREFFKMILWQFPYVVDAPFKKRYAGIPWRNDAAEFERWKVGQTGYPLVDAGMRELNETGFMHNRVRMVTASFLVKHLLVDWRWGEGYFAEKLLDFELSSNNGNWQWAAGCGCDAAPYFRVFNPELQQKKFDPQRTYIKKWVPEIDSDSYPVAIVDHKFARQRVLAAYKSALS